MFMLNKKNRIGITVSVLLAIVGLIFGLFVSQYVHRTHQIDTSQFHGAWLDKPRELSAFHLMQTDETVFDNQSLLGHWTMVFFGFTTCPSVCPTTMVELSKMFRLLEKNSVMPMPRVILVSLDPETDSLGKLKEYVTAFNPNFLGARGVDDAAVKTMAQEIGIAYTKVYSSENEQKYTIDHTGTIMLFNPEGNLTAFFTMPHQAKELAKDYQLAVATRPSLIASQH